MRLWGGQNVLAESEKILGRIKYVVVVTLACLFCSSAKLGAQTEQTTDPAEASEEPNPLNMRRMIGDLQKIREEISTWDQSVRGFRSEHHFALVGGPLNGSWHFKRFGTQINKRHRDSGYILKFQYSYHIPIYRSFGYFLGSSAGVWKVTQQASQARLQSSAMLPGILAGLVYNFSPGYRALAGIDYYLERWSVLQERDRVGEDPSISVTARTTDLFVAMDFFYKLKWSFRAEVHKRRLDFYGTKKGDGKAVDAVIARDDEWYGFGLLYHLM